MPKLSERRVPWEPLTPRIAAIGFSPQSAPLLARLVEAGVVTEVRWPADPTSEADPTPLRPEAPATWLSRQWTEADAVLAVGACGLMTRLVAPLLGSKEQDPAVVVLDPEGRFAIPLLGGHAGGGEALCSRLAQLLGGEAILTGACASASRLPLDSFGQRWGWRRGNGDWDALMKRVRGDTAAIPQGWIQECGTQLWERVPAVSSDRPSPDRGRANPGHALVISHRVGPGCHWHPPCLWLGMGCERDTSPGVLNRLVDSTLARDHLAPEAVAGLASIDRKGDEPALLLISSERNWPLRLFGAADLAEMVVPHPSATVAREMGTASVAEAAALRASGQGGTLLVPKSIERAGPGEQGAATLAIGLSPQQWAPQRGCLHLIGSGPGRLDLLTADARQALASTSVWVGYGPYLDKLEPLRRPDQLRLDGQLTEERERCALALDLACQGLPTALISSGDSGIYGMAGLALELWLELPCQDRPVFSVHPGISAVQLAAARAGAPLMHDFCTISLSDRLTPWPVIERRLVAAAVGDFVVALYNPRSRGRDWQLARARELFLANGRSPQTPVLLARQLGREAEAVRIHQLDDLPVEQVDMLTLVLIGNSSTYVEEGRMVTPRGYQGAVLS